MQIHNLSESNSVLNHFLAQIRDVSIQNDSLRFRRNIERIGEIMAYELSKVVSYEDVSISTPLGTKATTKIKDPLVICSILRAGLTLHHGFLNYFDAAENGFISAYRHHPNNDDYFDILVEYQAVADIEGKNVLQKLVEKKTPAALHIAVVIAAPEGIAYLKEHLPSTCHLWIGAIDEKLNKKSYIVPGLGDAGDLAYGPKL